MKFLELILKFFASLVLKKFKPLIIGVTGSAGKTSTKEAIFLVLKYHFFVRRNFKSYNNRLGVALTILDSQAPGRNIFKWLVILIKSFWLLILPKKWQKYPEILILEMGIDRPGDFDYFLRFIKPKIGVVTIIGEIPVHVEFFAGPEELAVEKAKLIEALPKDGTAILNYDDVTVLDMRHKTQARVLTFGFEKGADIRITEYNLTLDGIHFKIERDGNVVPFRLFRSLGKAQAYTAAAAVAAGLTLKMNLVEISQALLNYQSPPGRMRLMAGIKKTNILDDTYNASPLAMKEALEVLKELPGKRKIAVLGDMLEIGKYSEAAHREMGDLAAKFVDYLFTVGPRAKFIADEALIHGLEQNQVFSFNTSEEVGLKLQEIMEENDLILIKGSQAMRMEKIVEEIMAEPEKAKELLVRQEKSWKKK